MKNLREWLDSLSDKTRAYVAVCCKDWMDVTTEDGYRYDIPSLPGVLQRLCTNLSPDKNEVKYDLLYLLRNNLIPEECKNDVIIRLNYLLNSWARIDQIREDVEGGVTLYDYLTLNTIKRMDDDDLNLFNTEVKKLWVKTNTQYCPSFSSYLLGKDDYDTLSIEDYQKYMNNDFMICDFDVFNEIFGENCSEAYYKTRPHLLMKTLTENQMTCLTENKLFDKLFFEENNNYNRKKYELFYNQFKTAYNLDNIKAFLYHLCSVDTMYLHLIYDIVNYGTSIAEIVYSARATADDEKLLGVKEGEYLFSKPIRQLFKMAFYCVKRRLPKTSKAGPMGAVVKLYDYKWDDVFASLYPEEAERYKEATENNTY